VKAAIAADGDANALVSTADAAGNDGSGLVAAVGPVELSGGTDAGADEANKHFGALLEPVAAVGAPHTVEVRVGW
jgi:hypothetical protein